LPRVNEAARFAGVDAAAAPVETRYPGVGPRAAATIADWIVGFIVVGVPLLGLFGHHRTTHQNGAVTTSWSTSDPKVTAAWVVLGIAYYVVFEATLGATPGKFMLGLRVRMADGAACTWRAATIRNALRVVDGLPYFIPYLLGAVVVWSDDPEPSGQRYRRRRRVGDRVAGTLVVYR
jgi:uncharacterized RDD family membrane protein YckC